MNQNKKNSYFLNITRMLTCSWPFKPHTKFLQSEFTHYCEILPGT